MTSQPTRWMLTSRRMLKDISYNINSLAKCPLNFCDLYT